jgi:hypothetical protein
LNNIPLYIYTPHTYWGDGIKMDLVSVREDEKVLEMEDSGGCTAM